MSIIDVIASTRMCCSGIIAAAATWRGFDERIMSLEESSRWWHKDMSMARVGQEKRVCLILMYFVVYTVHLVQFMIQTSSHHTRKQEKPS